MPLKLPNDILIIIVGYAIQNYKSLLYINKQINKITYDFLYGYDIYFDHIPILQSKKDKCKYVCFKIDSDYNTNENNILKMCVISDNYFNYYNLQINIINNILYFKALYFNINCNKIISILLQIGEFMLCYNKKKTGIFMLTNISHTIYVVNKWVCISYFILQLNGLSGLYNNFYMINGKYNLLYYKQNKNPYIINKLRKDKKNKINTFIFKKLCTEYKEKDIGYRNNRGRYLGRNYSEEIDYKEYSLENDSYEIFYIGFFKKYSLSFSNTVYYIDDYQFDNEKKCFFW